MSGFSNHIVPDSPPQPLPLGSDICEANAPDQQVILECLNWLSFHRIWGVLGDDILQAIAQSLQLLTVKPETAIYQQDQATVGLYFLKWGSVEIFRQSPVGRTHIRYRSAGDIFGYVSLVAASAEITYQASAGRDRAIRTRYVAD